jgi:hypothetical protein
MFKIPIMFEEMGELYSQHNNHEEDYHMKSTFVALAMIGAILLSLGGGDYAVAQLLSSPVDTPPAIDGVAEDVWNAAAEVVIPVAGGANNSSTQVGVRSVNTKDMIYFLLQWADPTESVVRFPWKKQADGTWKQLVSPGGEENTYYEDKLAMIWNINDSIASFNQIGCMTTCHAGEAGKPFGNKYTATPGERGDIWHWKGVRTNPVGQVDDQYVDDTRYDANTAPEAGRKSDPATGGGYKDNVNAAKDGPAFTSLTQPGTYWILDEQKTPFVDTYDKGDEIAGIIVAKRLGDRGDISGKGVYAGGKWTLEIGRLKNTGSEFDVQFTDPLKKYYFGVSTFDNAQVRHSWQAGVTALSFVTTPTGIEPQGKLATTWGRMKIK